MANLNQPPSRVTPNLLHILNAFTDSSNSIVNTIVELNSNTINKYELITETGHLISAQISNHMEKDVGLIDNVIENGEYQKIISWLKNNIHKYGRSVNCMELVRAVTNEELSPDYFINHLRSKINDFC